MLPSLLLLTASLAPTTSSLPPSPRFPWLRTFASIGDSYSAGLGAGPRLDFSCSRYADSHPHILHTLLLGPDPHRTHAFFSCSGATSTEILATQVPALPENIDLLTLSAGGNDVGLTPILSDCIYQFYMAGAEACAQSLDAAQNLIDDETQLFANVSKLVHAALPKMNPHHGVVYITGYAGFFALEDATCDTVSWSVWPALALEKQFLTLALRTRLDALVRAVNAVLARVAATSGPRVRFIDYNAHIAAARGRFCEAGVQEPAPNRPALAFYEWGTVDPAENRTALLNETGGDVPRGSFESGIAERVGRTLRERPGWEFDPEMGFVERNRTEGRVDGEGAVGDTVHWLLPDSWKRVFHLRPEGQRLVAELVVRDLERWEGGGEGDGEWEEL